METNKTKRILITISKEGEYLFRPAVQGKIYKARGFRMPLGKWRQLECGDVLFSTGNHTAATDVQRLAASLGYKVEVKNL